MKTIRKILLYLLILGFVGTLNTCVSSRRGVHHEKSGRRKIKPCNCPKFGIYETRNVAVKFT